MTHHFPLRAALAALAFAALCAACTDEGKVSLGTRPRAGLPSEGALAAVPLGDVAGVAPNLMAEQIANPYAGKPSGVRAGEVLFTQMNCVGCHGYTAQGGMGPDLTDSYWRYGGAPAEIYKSIYEGRPKGMPAWGTVMAPEDIWKMVAYIQSLGGAVPPAFANEAMLGNEYGSPGALSSLKGRQAEDQP